MERSTSSHRRGNDTGSRSSRARHTQEQGKKTSHEHHRTNSGKAASISSSITSVSGKDKATKTIVSLKERRRRSDTHQDSDEASASSDDENRHDEQVAHSSEDEEGGNKSSPRILQSEHVECEDSAESQRNDLNSVIQRIVVLEGKVDSLSRQMSTMTRKGHAGRDLRSSIELTEFIKSKIGAVVRDFMFSSIKYLDDNMVQSQGDVIFKKCMAEAHVDMKETNNQTMVEVIKLARKYLNVHKCHVRKKLRLAAVGKHVQYLVVLG
jgi:hypothetical protein